MTRSFILPKKLPPEAPRPATGRHLETSRRAGPPVASNIARQRGFWIQQ